MKEDLKTCPDCGEQFADVFEAVDHLLEDDEEFDPALILPNGYRLMVGSLLRSIFENSDNPDRVEQIVQDTYMTLFMAEVSPHTISNIIQDIIVEDSMAEIDNELRKLLENGEK